MRKRRTAESILCGFKRAIIAFSGGVDSTLLAVLARDVLGCANVLAATADSPSLAREDLADACFLARELGLEHVVLKTGEVERPEYQANSRARCYFCKQTLFEQLRQLSAKRGIAAVLYGAIGDDRIDERPGHQAAAESGVCAPLQQAGLSKTEVRRLARQLGLPNWDKPQSACLSSRVPHGSPVTAEKLRQIEQAERFLRAQGFRQVRVRHWGLHARIEVEPQAVSRFNESALRFSVEQAFRVLGFQSVGVDLAGYREGGADLAASGEVLLNAVGKC